MQYKYIHPLCPKPTQPEVSWGSPFKQLGTHTSPEGLVQTVFLCTGCGMHFEQLGTPDKLPTDGYKVSHLECICKNCAVCGGEKVICGVCNMCTRCHEHNPGCPGCPYTG